MGVETFWSKSLLEAEFKYTDYFSLTTSEVHIENSDETQMENVQIWIIFSYEDKK